MLNEYIGFNEGRGGEGGGGTQNNTCMIHHFVCVRITCRIKSVRQLCRFEVKMIKTCVFFGFFSFLEIKTRTFRSTLPAVAFSFGFLSFFCCSSFLKLNCCPRKINKWKIHLGFNGF